MQWNIEALQNWDEVKEYVDTALLVHYIYEEDRPLPEHALRLTYLMSLAGAIEQRLTGRIMMFPAAYHVADEAGKVALHLPQDFAYKLILRFSGHDFTLSAETVQGQVQFLTVGDQDLDSQIRFDITVDVLFKEILHIWQPKVAK
ncbi:DUF2487 family protein [Brevibacillus dissolubilis]|uniref:DUF2487 family protein n=1 Tax=Brevibacillus dissolubilis TaxID=1844116 RepID=UPI0011177673|nr:DUF2487 family protein [Brevibacillus dissolubilis]